MGKGVISIRFCVKKLGAFWNVYYVFEEDGRPDVLYLHLRKGRIVPFSSRSSAYRASHRLNNALVVEQKKEQESERTTHEVSDCL